MGCCSSHYHWLLLAAVLVVHLGLAAWLALAYRETGREGEEGEGVEKNVTDLLIGLVRQDSERFSTQGLQGQSGISAVLGGLGSALSLSEVSSLLSLVSCPTRNSATSWAWVTQPGLPGSACGVPRPGSSPSVKYLAHLAQRLAKIGCSDPESCSQSSCDPYMSVYETSTFCFIGSLFRELRRPQLDDWRSDAAFTRQFLQGVNPMVIRHVRSLEEVHPSLRSLAVEASGRERTVSSLVAEGRLLVADYSALASLPLVQGRVFYAPQALFVKSSSGSLEVVAIVLASPHSQEHVLTPRSKEYRWLYAKMHVAMADSAIHEFQQHLRTHLVMESVTIARHNWLEQDDHMIGRLLKPHTTNTIFINFAARNSLIAEEDSGVERMFSVGRDGAVQLIAEDLAQRYQWDSEMFPAAMEARGFPQNGSDGVKDFPYREDGFLLWSALHRYVEGVVEAEYPTDEAVQGDARLVGFHTSLASKEEGNIPGFPAQPGTRKQLSTTLTAIIFSASVHHHVLNSPHHMYSYPPHRPTLLTKWMPDGDDDLSWSWIKESLPELSLASDVFKLTMLLSTHSLCSLSSLDVFEDDLPSVHNRLRADLSAVSQAVRARGGEYDYMDPTVIACSVDI